MPAYIFERIARTPHSEQWRIDNEVSAIGRVDLHFTGSKAYGTLAVHTSVPEAEIEELIADIDARLVSTADEYREDFVVTVWRGVEFGTYSEDGPTAIEDEFEDDAVTEDDVEDDDLDDGDDDGDDDDER